MKKILLFAALLGFAVACGGNEKKDDQKQNEPKTETTTPKPDGEGEQPNENEEFNENEETNVDETRAKELNKDNMGGVSDIKKTPKYTVSDADFGVSVDVANVTVADDSDEFDFGGVSDVQEATLTVNRPLDKDFQIAM